MSNEQKLAQWKTFITNNNNLINNLRNALSTKTGRKLLHSTDKVGQYTCSNLSQNNSNKSIKKKDNIQPSTLKYVVQKFKYEIALVPIIMSVMWNIGTIKLTENEKDRNNAGRRVTLIFSVVCLY